MNISLSESVNTLRAIPQGGLNRDRNVGIIPRNSNGFDAQLRYNI